MSEKAGCVCAPECAQPHACSSASCTPRHTHGNDTRQDDSTPLTKPLTAIRYNPDYKPRLPKQSQPPNRTTMQVCALASAPALILHRCVHLIIGARSESLYGRDVASLNFCRTAKAMRHGSRTQSLLRAQKTSKCKELIRRAPRPSSPPPCCWRRRG